MLLWCFEYSYYSSPLRYLLVNIKINIFNYCHHYSFEMLLNMWYIETRISCMLNYYFTDEYCSLCPLDKHCFICSILTVTHTITDSMANLVVFHKIHIEPSYVAKRTFDTWKIHLFIYQLHEYKSATRMGSICIIQKNSTTCSIYMMAIWDHVDDSFECVLVMHD